MDTLAYKPTLSEVLDRLSALYERRARDRIFAVMDVPSRVLDEFRATYSEGYCEYPDPAERIDFWDRLLRERTALQDDSVPSAYLSELEARRSTILDAIDAQGRLTEELRGRLESARTRTELEDLYLPYKPKRRTKAQIAREAGLAPLAQSLRDDPTQSPETVAAAYLDTGQGVADVSAALDGARQILMEDFAEDAALTAEVRDWLWDNARLKSSVAPDKEKEGAKFSDYFEHSEPLNKVPSHRALALFYLRAPGWPKGPGDADLGLEHAREAVRLRPEHPPNLLAPGEALDAVGERAESRSLNPLSRALSG